MNKKYFLATTALEEFWDKNKKILFLNPVFNNICCNKKDAINLLWYDKKEVEKAWEYCFYIFDIILEQIVRIFNKIFNINFDKKFYETLIGFWLLEFILTVYERYYSLKYLISQYNYNIETIILDKRSNIIPFNFEEFVARIKNL